LWKIEQYVGEDVMPYYSNPGIFFQEWLRAEQERQKKIKAERKAAKALKKAQKAERKKRREAGEDVDRKSKKDKSAGKMKLLPQGVRSGDSLNDRQDDGFDEVKDGTTEAAEVGRPSSRVRPSFQYGADGVVESKGEGDIPHARASMGWDNRPSRISQGNLPDMTKESRQSTGVDNRGVRWMVDEDDHDERRASSEATLEEMKARTRSTALDTTEPPPMMSDMPEDDTPLFAIPISPKGAHSALIGRRKPPPPPPPPGGGERKKLLGSINSRRPSVKFDVNNLPRVSNASVVSNHEEDNLPPPDDYDLNDFQNDFQTSRHGTMQATSRHGTMQAAEALEGEDHLDAPPEYDAGYDGGDEPPPPDDYEEPSPRPENPFAKSGLLGDIAGIFIQIHFPSCM
jgi:hypothetical protein